MSRFHYDYSGQAFCTAPFFSRTFRVDDHQFPSGMANMFPCVLISHVPTEVHARHDKLTRCHFWE
jgi:hypothetical protein